MELPGQLAIVLGTKRNTSARGDADVTGNIQHLDEATSRSYNELTAAYTERSCCCLSKRSPLRKLCIHGINNATFKIAISIIILSNCVALGLSSNRVGFESTHLGQALSALDKMFVAVFTLEMIMKVLAMGFVLEKETYLRDGWNVLDFAVVILSYVNLFTPNNLTGIRAIRALRPLRMMHQLKGMRVLVTTMLRSLPMLLDVLLLCTFMFFMFSLVAVQLFGGVLRYRCGLPDFSGAVNVTGSDGRILLQNVSYIVPDDQAEDTCSGPLSSEVAWYLVDGVPTPAAGGGYDGRICSDGMYCTPYENPSDGYISYDNVLWSWLTIFQHTTLSGWADVMFLVMDAVNSWVWIYYAVLIVLGAFFMINLALAVLVANFAADNAESKKKGDQGRIAKGVSTLRRIIWAILDKRNKAARADRRSGGEGAAASSSPPAEAAGTVRRFVLRVATSKALEYTTVTFIVINTAIMCVNWYGMPVRVERVTNYVNHALTAYFLVELLVRLSAVGSSRFFRDGMNVFDALVVLVSMVETVIDLIPSISGVGPLSVLRAFRLLRIFRLVRNWRVLNAIILGMFKSLRSSLMLVLLMLLFIFIAALMGMQLFGYKFMFCDYVEGAKPICPLGLHVWGQCPNHFYCYLPCEAEQYGEWVEAPGSFYNDLGYCDRFCASEWAAAAADANVTATSLQAAVGCEYLAMVGKSQVPRAHFDNVVWAMYTVFQLLTGENWNDIMFNGMRTASNWASLYFVAVIVIGNYLVFNLFIAILIDNLNVHHTDDKSGCGATATDTDLSTLPRVEGGGAGSPRQEKEEHPDGVHGPEPVGDLRVCRDGTFGEDATRGGAHIQDNGTATAVLEPSGTTQHFRTYADCDGIAVACKGATDRSPLALSATSANFFSCRLSESGQEGCSATDSLATVAAQGGPVGESMTIVGTPGARQPPSGHSAQLSDGTSTFLVHCVCESPERASPFQSKPPGAAMQVSSVQPPKPFSGQPNSALLSLSTYRSFRRSHTSLSERTGLIADTEIEGRSLFLFGPNHKLRRYAAAVVRSRYFEAVILFIIAASCICLVLDAPSLDSSSQLATVLRYADYTFTGAFTLEALLMIVTFGFAFTCKHAYIRSGWNILDFAIVVLGYVLIALDALEMQNNNLTMLRVLRALRALRPLRAARRFEGLRLVVNSLFAVLPSMGNVMLVCLLFYLIFAILAVNLFKGKLYNCIGADSGERLDPFYVLPPGQVLTAEWCRQGSQTITDSVYYTARNVSMPAYELQTMWVNPMANFDNVATAMLTLFQVASLSMWVDIAFNAVDATHPGQQPLYNRNPAVVLFFIFFVIVCSFVVLNLFVGVTIEKFAELHQELRTPWPFLSPGQQRWLDTQRMVLHTHMQYKPPRPAITLRKALYDIVTRPSFDIFIIVVILANMVFMALVHFGMSSEWQAVMSYSNLVFTSIFVVEALVKMTALGPQNYLRDGWNCFDLFVVAVSIVSVVLDFTDMRNLSFILMLRALRIVRVARLLRNVPNMRKLMRTLAMSLSALANVGGVTLLFFFVFAVFGVNLFAGIKPGSTLSEKVNFNSFSNTMMVLFWMLTGESWNAIMQDCMMDCDCVLVLSNTTSSATNTTLLAGSYYDPGDPLLEGVPAAHLQNQCPLSPVAAIIYFPAFLILCTLILLQLVIAVLLENLVSEDADEDLPVSKAALDAFAEAWSQVDGIRRGLIQASQLPAVLALTPPPLGVMAIDRQHVELQRLLLQLRVPLFEGNRVCFIEVLHALAGRVCAIPLPEPAEARAYSELAKRLPAREPHASYTSAHYHAVAVIETVTKDFLLRRKQRCGKLDHTSPVQAREAAEVG